MFSTCPYCGANIRAHETCCRVPHELDRFERVYQRLAAGHENNFLQTNLLRYLVAYGRRDEGWQPGF
jgi:hypothetical protein